MGRPIKKGSTDQSTVIKIIDSTTGLPETAVEHNTAGIDLWFRREKETKTSITEAALAALDSAHSDGGIEHISDGHYRLDLPDAAVAAGSGENSVQIGGTVTGMVVIGNEHALVDYDPYDSVRAGLTALPNAAADAAGGLPISDAGGLDMDNNVETACEAALGDAICGPYTHYVDGTNGDNGNSGELWFNPLETITQAVTNASSGDTIIIAPGTYSEAVNASSKSLYFVGQGYRAVTIDQTGTSNKALQLDDNSSVKNIRCVGGNSSGGMGIYANGKQNIRITNVYAYGYSDGINTASNDRVFIEGCYIKSDFDGLLITGNGNIVRNTVVEITGVATSEVNAVKAGGGNEGESQIFDNVLILATRTATASTDVRGMEINNNNVVLNNVSICVELGANASGDAIALYLYGSTAPPKVMANGVVIRTDVTHASSTAYDISTVVNSEVLLNGCVYDTTKTTGAGTITQVNSGWAAAVNTEADTALSDINLDHWMKVACGVDDVTDNAALAKIVSKGATADWSDFDNTDGSLQALKDKVLTNSAVQDTLDVLLRTILESTVMTVTTVATLASQTSFTLAAGSPDNDAYNDCMIVLKSVSTPARKAIGIVLDYTGSSKTVALVADPGIFTLYVGDEVFIMSVPKSIADIKKLLRADKVIDTAETPWVLDYKEEGTEDVLMGKTLKKADGTNVTSENSVLGQLEQE